MPKKTKNPNDYDRRSRVHMLLLYPDNENHKKALEYTIARISKYAFALHDKDTFEEDNIERGIKEGDPKKTHWHVVLKFTDSRTRSSIVKQYKGLIDKTDIIPYSGTREALLYLVHAENTDKYQYDKEIVDGTLKNEFLDYYSTVGINENDIYNEIIEYIDSNPTITYKLLALYCNQMGYLRVYRKYYYMLKDLIIEKQKMGCNYKNNWYNDGGKEVQ